MIGKRLPDNLIEVGHGCRYPKGAWGSRVDHPRDMSWEVEMIYGLAIFLTAALVCVSCGKEPVGEDDAAWEPLRAAMVQQIRDYGVRDERVLRAMAKVRRHVYIPEAYRGRDAYGDHPCPIGHDQTISQPYIVAYMTEKMNLKPGEKVLEIGTGSGYQAAILAEMGAKVYTIEIIPELADHARRVLTREGYGQVKVLTGDGYKGWPEHAPFDAIIVTCAPTEVPQALVDQLADGGRMILPLGAGIQRLVILRKKGNKVEQEEDLPVRFVPMVRGKE
ncbi:MAG: protein-L-isoaspartate(D-aspartate) O-methyltransferase [Kiritimatiellae bacterium]|nr:protein-L-isoaspartate(D-aspartate) O-methyltransferase [Kiritimatiellia bacterium]